MTVTHHHIFGSVYLAIAIENRSMKDLHRDFTYFTIDDNISYTSFADDFGPMNLGSVFQFCSLLDHQLAQHQENSGSIALLCCGDKRSLTNAVFLLGSYMIMMLDTEIDKITCVFDSISSLLLAYRDVSFGIQNFDLHVHDCWKGLIKAKKLGWVDFGPGGFDLNDYQHLDSPLNADLHELVPGKFVAMRGPRDLPNGLLFEDVSRDDGAFSHRDFSPAHYAEILQQFDVCAVIRLNAPQYDRGPFTAAGIALADLWFEDCTEPPVDIVAKFLSVAESLPGAIAVHCQAGLGRTGTLVALYIMKHHDFSAREAMGWLRIVRPGSVIGPQQQFLCAREALMRRSAGRLHPASPACEAAALAVAAAGGGVAAVQALINETIRAYDARYAAALGDAAPPPPVSALLPSGCCRALSEHVSAAANRRNGARSAEASDSGRSLVSVDGAPSLQKSPSM